MAVDPDTKLAVLRGVYEDNVGIPRTRGGQRGPEAGGEAPAPAAPADRQPRFHTTRVVLAILFGLGIFGTYLQGIAPSNAVSSYQVVVAPAPVNVPYRLDASPAGPQVPLLDREVVAGAAASGPAMGAYYQAVFGNLDVSVADLFGLTVHTIVIDPGHGGRDPGAIGYQGLQEKDVTLDIARRLRDKLEAEGDYRVVLTREDDSAINLRDRVTKAKAHQADLFISIHINSVPAEKRGVNYVETYYFGPHADSDTLALAESENQGSDYAMGDFREIIARIGDTMKTEESAQLAEAIHENLYRNLKRHSSGLLDAGAKSGPFVVLLGSDVPSVLVEVSCISNPGEADRLGTAEYRDDVASYLKTGVVTYLERRAPHTQPDGVSTQYVAQQEG